jgi:hypothetical protein
MTTQTAAALPEAQIQEMAEKIYNANFGYRVGDSCPCCGYDGLWPDQRDDAISYIAKMLRSVNDAN